MSNMTQTAKRICLVISDKSDTLNLSLFETWLNENCNVWSYIKHDKDINNDGEKKFIHYHAVIELRKVKIRLGTTLNSLSKALNINPFAIQLDKCNNYGLSLQYLIHKNNPEKYQYGLKYVHTNIPLEEFTLSMSESLDVINYDTLKTVCAESMGSRLYIMERIGIGYYSKYRNVINDILAEIIQVESRFKSLK